MEQKIIQAWEFIRLDNSESLDDLLNHGIKGTEEHPDKSIGACFLPHAAAVFGSVNCLRKLVEFKVNLNKCTEDGFSIGHWAAYSGQTAVLEFLGGKVDFTAKDNFGQTPLHVACSRGHLNAVKYLINKCDINGMANYNWTPLHFAVVYGHEEIAAHLVHSNARTDIPDTFGRTPAILALEYNRRWWFSIHP